MIDDAFRRAVNAELAPIREELREVRQMLKEVATVGGYRLREKQPVVPRLP